MVSIDYNTKSLHSQENSLLNENLTNEWTVQQWEKYQSNLKYLRNSNNELERNHPVLYKFIQKYLSVLEYLNTHRMEGIRRSFSYQGEHVFFTSTIRIQEYVGISQSSAVRSVNMLTLIGMIMKIPHDKLPGKLLYISNRIMQNRILKGYKGGKRITFYQVPKYNKEILDSAEETVKKILESGMWGSIISKRRVENVFGVEKAKEVFLPDYQVKKVLVETEDTLLSDPNTPSIEDIKFVI